MLAERDEALARYLELERVGDADLLKANQALEQATKEKNKARVQFATQKIRQFLEAAEGVEACSSDKNPVVDP
ncbi:hypothetical protein LIER_11422 [Lithospermum erythrorhizon]|uniref:Uncharacterized protein n=1 Tax=Lithospermum erythrorhizon TaxID=34254 RepID=A0AAV3PSC1_LITER